VTLHIAMVFASTFGVALLSPRIIASIVQPGANGPVGAFYIGAWALNVAWLVALLLGGG
jgi:hypothetical protein